MYTRHGLYTHCDFHQIQTKATLDTQQHGADGCCQVSLYIELDKSQGPTGVLTTLYKLIYVKSMTDTTNQLTSLSVN